MTFTEALYQRRILFRQSPQDRNEITICCPFCPDNGETPDTRFRLGINTATGAGHCFNCGFKGRHVLSLVLRKLRIETSGLESEEPSFLPAPEPICLPHDFQTLTHTYDTLDRQALQYLLKRGITENQIRRNHIGVSYVGKLAYRIVFPVWVGRDLKGLVARDFTGRQKPKYLNSAGDKYLYHFNPSVETVILSEGVFKALRIEQVIPKEWNSAALLGHDLTTIQLEQLKSSACRRVVLFPDPDRVGRRGIVKIADLLGEEWPGKRMIAWPVRVPADELPLSDLGILLKNIKNYSFSLRQKVSIDSY